MVKMITGVAITAIAAAKTCRPRNVINIRYSLYLFRVFEVIVIGVAAAAAAAAAAAYV